MGKRLRHTPRARRRLVGSSAMGAAPTPIPRLLAGCGSPVLSEAELAELRSIGGRLSEAEWRQLLGEARAQGMAPLVLAHTARAGLLPLLPPSVAAALLDEYRGAWFWNRRLRGALTRLLAALEARGIEALPVKGVVLAARAYGELALRPTSDLDLLVRRADLAMIAQVLVELGYQPIAGESDPHGFYALVHQALTFRGRAGEVVELHWELANLPAYRACLPAEALWRRARRVQWAERTIRALAPADELRYLCFHCAAQHQHARLLWLVDIAALVRALPAEWDWPAFVRETVADGLATPVLVALARAQRALGLALPAGVLVALADAAAARGERRRWAAAHAPFSRLDSLARYLLAQRDARARLTLAWALVVRGVTRWRRETRLAGRRQRAFPWVLPWGQAERSLPLDTGSPVDVPTPAAPVPALVAAPAFLARETDSTAKLVAKSVPHVRSG